MRIALLGPTHPFRGGLAHHTTLLAKVLGAGHDLLFLSYTRQYPRLLYPGASDRDTSEQGLVPERVEYVLDSLNPLSWVSTARRIARHDPETLILPWWTVFWTLQTLVVILLVRRWTGARIVILCHNSVEHEASAWKVAAARIVLSRADHIVTQSREETRRVRELIGPHHSVATGFHPTYAPLGGNPESGETARKALGLSGPVLLFFGFVRPYKGLDILLEAMPSVLDHFPATLLIVGEFWKDKTRYLDMIDRLDLAGHIILEDRYIPNEAIGRYFSAADLVVQPYLSATGSGISQLAYGLGKPVVATRVGSLDDVIRDGENGRLVPPGDASALSSAIIDSLAPSTLARLARGAGETSRRFSWDGLAELLLAS